MIRRVVLIVAGVVAAWLILLVVLGLLRGGRIARGVADRLGESLQGTATFEGSDLSLVRGRLELERVTVRRDDAIGQLSLDVAGVRCELPPLGLALVDRECREL